MALRTKRTEADRQYTRYENLKGQIRSIYRRARDYGHPHTWIMVECSRLYDSDDWKKLQAQYRSMIHAIGHVLLAELYERDLVWRTGPQAGPIYTAGDEWTPEHSDLARTPGALYGDHFYIAHPGKGFGEWKPINAPRPEPTPAPTCYCGAAIGETITHAADCPHA